MTPNTRTPTRYLAALAAAVCLACPTHAWAWGFDTHHYIAQHYSQHLPPYLDGLQVYDAEVDSKVTLPDSRRSYTPGEAERHYIDIDYYPEFLAGTLPHQRAAVEALYSPAIVIDVGIVPWAIEEVVGTLTAQFQAHQWSQVAATIADLCHYVGDANQPLHCTENYNGQLTGNSGIHSRYETTMMNSHLNELVTPPTNVTYYPSVVDAMFDMIGVSWTGVAPIMDADDDAKIASGGSTSSATYYNSLWSDLEVMTRAQVNTATVVTASCVYTAWVDAGQPPIPGSSADVGPSPATSAALVAGPSPFRFALDVRYAGSGPFDVDVFDVRGARVARLADGASGQGRVEWRPTADVGAGVYFVRMTGPGLQLVRRVTRIR